MSRSSNFLWPKNSAKGTSAHSEPGLRGPRRPAVPVQPPCAKPGPACRRTGGHRGRSCPGPAGLPAGVEGMLAWGGMHLTGSGVDPQTETPPPTPHLPLQAQSVVGCGPLINPPVSNCGAQKNTCLRLSLWPQDGNGEDGGPARCPSHSPPGRSELQRPSEPARRRPRQVISARPAVSAF